jgi:5-(carboxyamino)imidazole ribonucleotide mutase
LTKVSIIMGSSSDKEQGEKAKALLDEFGVEGETRILSAHRNPRELDEYVKKCGSEVFIAIAGLSAALPGYIAARTTKPVIGVPREVKLGGLDALLSIAQMPRGVPVACVSIDGAANAALLAVEILALRDSELEKRLSAYRERWSTAR